MRSQLTPPHAPLEKLSDFGIRFLKMWISYLEIEQKYLYKNRQITQIQIILTEKLKKYCTNKF